MAGTRRAGGASAVSPRTGQLLPWVLLLLGGASMLYSAVYEGASPPAGTSGAVLLAAGRRAAAGTGSGKQAVGPAAVTWEVAFDDQEAAQAAETIVSRCAESVLLATCCPLGFKAL